MASILDRSRQIAVIPLRLMRAPFTVARQLRDMVNDRGVVGQSRRAFVEDLTGRAKALAGFLLGDERLITTGQIERTQAAERMSAVAEEAAADAIERKAAEKTGAQIAEVKEERAEAARKKARRTAAIARETEQDQQRIAGEAERAARAVEFEAAKEELVIDATDSVSRIEAALVLDAAAEEEAAAEQARLEAEAIEAARGAK
ncbi:MAG: hypothetical protein WEB06_04975 [Actinomycetota bacterium]